MASSATRTTGSSLTATAGSPASNGAATGLTADAGKIGIWIFLVTDGMGFGALLVAYAVLRARASQWPDTTQRLMIPLAAAMSLTLLTSSLTALFALAAARAGRSVQVRRWLCATVACGLAFLGGQAFEYHHLLDGSPAMGLSSDLFASTFYVITGFHGLHLLAGITVLGLWLARGRKRAPPARALEVAVLYWHFVDLAWMPIFTFLYLLPVR